MPVNGLTYIYDLLSLHADDTPLFANKRGREWQVMTAGEYRFHADQFTQYLLNKGLKKGDKIITLMDNRPEWNIVDMGALQAGLWHVSLSLMLKDEQFRQIVEEVQPALIVTSKKSFYNRIIKALGDEYARGNMLLFEQDENNVLWQELQSVEMNSKQIEASKNSIAEDDVATIIYTSGTTDTPKGVMLTHRNITSAIKTFAPKLWMQKGEKAMSILPLCHIGERKMNYSYQYLGLTTYYASMTKNVLNNLKDARPDITALVPFLLSELKAQMTEDGDNERLSLGKIVCGGASVPNALLEYFWNQGIKVYEVYGLTETSAIFSFNYGNHVRFGTAGKVLDGMEVRVSEDGELLCRGPYIMKGYFNQPEVTSNMIDDAGWLHTGDIGMVDDEGYVVITGRKKNMLKVSRGLYVSPEYLEKKLRESSLVKQCMVLGDNMDYLSALIVPDEYHLRKSLGNGNIDFLSKRDNLRRPEVQALYQAEIDRFNRQQVESERIEKFQLVDDDWTVASGELSTFMKLRRKVIFNKYHDLIETLYKAGATTYNGKN